MDQKRGVVFFFCSPVPTVMKEPINESCKKKGRGEHKNAGGPGSAHNTPGNACSLARGSHEKPSWLAPKGGGDFHPNIRQQW